MWSDLPMSHDFGNYKFTQWQSIFFGRTHTPSYFIFILLSLLLSCEFTHKDKWTSKQCFPWVVLTLSSLDSNSHTSPSTSSMVALLGQTKKKAIKYQTSVHEVRLHMFWLEEYSKCVILNSLIWYATQPSTCPLCHHQVEQCTPDTWPTLYTVFSLSAVQTCRLTARTVKLMVQLLLIGVGGLGRIVIGYHSQFLPKYSHLSKLCKLKCVHSIYILDFTILAVPCCISTIFHLYTLTIWGHWRFRYCTFNLKKQQQTAYTSPHTFLISFVRHRIFPFFMHPLLTSLLFVYCESYS